MKTTSYLEEPSRHFCQHFMRRTTQQTFSAINLTSQQKTTKLFFSSQVRRQFKLLTVPLKPLRCCLRSDKLMNCHGWKFCKDLFLNFREIWYVNQIELLMVFSLILLRSLRLYIISVNSGFRNSYAKKSRFRPNQNSTRTMYHWSAILRSFSVVSNSAKRDANGFFKVLLLSSHLLISRHPVQKSKFGVCVVRGYCSF